MSQDSQDPTSGGGTSISRFLVANKARMERYGCFEERHSLPSGDVQVFYRRPPQRQWATVVNIHQQGRAARPATNGRTRGSRRAGSSSSTSSADPGDDGEPAEPPPPQQLTLAPPVAPPGRRPRFDRPWRPQLDATLAELRPGREGVAR